MYPTLKRKRKDYEDDSSDEEEASYGKQILPVANLPADFNEEPTDGMQYLFTVRRDARRLPEVVWVSNPYEVPEPSRIPSSSKTATHPAMPSEEWCTLFEQRFRNFRQNFNQPTIHVGPTHEPSRRFMPEKKERDLWWAFLEGRPESEWHTPRKSKKQSSKKQQNRQGMRGWAEDSEIEQDQSYDITRNESWMNNDEGEVEQVLRVDPSEFLPTPSGTPAPSEQHSDATRIEAKSSSTFSEALEHRCFSPREPSTAVLKLIDERMALHLIMYFTHWINAYLQDPDQKTFIPRIHHARWIFALLSRIEDDISADDMNLLRNLARACLALMKWCREIRAISPRPSVKSSLPDSMNDDSCWIIVSIIVHVWKQRDLWVDAEEILSKK